MVRGVRVFWTVECFQAAHNRRQVQEIEGEEKLPLAAQVLLTRLRTHGQKYCSGGRLPIAGASEQCEREVEAQEEVVQENEACQVRSVWAAVPDPRSSCYPALAP